MKKTILYWLIATLMISVVSASMIIPASDVAKEKSKAPQNSPVISDNWELERVDFASPLFLYSFLN